MKKILIFISFIIFINANEFGLRDGDLESENVKFKDIVWSTKAAGTSTLIERSFENAPPLIPHDTEGMLDITKDINMCITCHMPDVAPAVNATAVPLSHLIDFRTSENLKDSLSNERYNCTLCHVPQAQISYLVKNNFSADFRQKDLNQTSNLMSILNQGVE